MKQIRDTRRAVEIVAAAKAAVCHVFHLAPSTMTASNRAQNICWPRQLATALAYEQSGLVPSALGPLFGKHRGTIIWAVQQVRDQREVCKIAQRQWDECVRTYERMMQAEDGNQLAVATTC